MIVQIKTIKLQSSDVYNFSSYPEGGFYMVSTENTASEIIVFIDNHLSIVQYICEKISLHSSANIVENEINAEGSKNMVSESFALKMLAVSNGNIKDITLD